MALEWLSPYWKLVPGTFTGVKAAGAWGWQPHHLHVPNVLKSGCLKLLEHSGPHRACYRTPLPLPLTLMMTCRGRNMWGGHKWHGYLLLIMKLLVSDTIMIRVTRLLLRYLTTLCYVRMLIWFPETQVIRKKSALMEWCVFGYCSHVDEKFVSLSSPFLIFICHILVFLAFLVTCLLLLLFSSNFTSLSPRRFVSLRRSL
jgi:hypothetical protein